MFNFINNNKLLYSILLGSVGLSLPAASAEYPDIVEVFPFSDNQRALSLNENEAFTNNLLIAETDNSDFTITTSLKKPKNKSNKKYNGFTGGAATLPTLNTIKYQTEEYLDSPVMHALTPGTGTDSDVSLIVDGQNYYYTPGVGENFEFLQLIASYANMAVVTTTDPAKAMYIYNDIMYTYDKNKLPLSSYNEIPSTQSGYNYATYSTDGYGNQTINYYDIGFNLVQPKEDGVTWEKVDSTTGYTWPDANSPVSNLVYSVNEDGASGIIRFTLPYKGTDSQTQYYKFTYNAPANYDKIISRESITTLPKTSDIYFYRVNGNGDLNGIALNIDESGRTILADFIGTTTNSNNQGNGTVYVGADTDRIEGNFIGNRVKEGGALELKANVNEVIGNFIGNTAKGTSVKNNGGAINAWNGKEINSIYGTFIANTSASGGAINNGGTLPFTIKILTGDFIANYAKNGNGGAIYNANVESVINAISGDYIANRAYSSSTAGSGGAIYNIGIIRDVTGDFIDNSASNKGGAIYNLKEMRYIVGDYIGNSAGQEGGAIYNHDNATIKEVTADFIHNISGTIGGAIHNKGKITLIAETSDVTFYDNKDSTGYNDIYQEGVKDSGGNYAGTILNLNTAENRVMAFNGTITGERGGHGYAPVININPGDTNGTNIGGIYEFNNTVSGNDINLNNNAYVKLYKIEQLDGTNSFGKLDLTGYNFTNDTLGGTLDAINGNIDNHILGDVTLNSILNAKIDIDLDSNSSDTFTITGGSSDNAININKINFSANDYYAYLDQEKIIKVLDRQNGNNIELTIDDSIKTTETLGTRINKYINIDSLSKHWNEKYYDTEETLVLRGLIDTVKSGSVGDKNDSIKYEITEIIESSNLVPSLRDTISVLNQAEGDRYFTAITPGTTYTTTEDLGETGAGTLTISGLDGSVFNIGLDTGFELRNDTTLTFDNVTIKGASPFVNVLNSDAAININNITAKSDIAGSVLFDLNTSGTNTFYAGISNANIINTGKLIFENDVSTKITNSNIFNSDSSELAVKTNNAFISTNLINNSSNSTLNLQTEAFETQNFDSITLNSDMNLAIDVDLAEKLTDNLTASTVSANGNKILIDSIYIMTDGVEPKTAVTLTEDKINFEDVFDLSNGIKIKTAPDVKSYGISYSDFGSISGYDENKGILIFDKLDINTLAEAVANETLIRSYTLPEGNENVEKNLGIMQGKSLSINGEGRKVLGNGLGTSYAGVTLGTTEQALIVDNVSEFSNFSTPAITNNSNGTVTISDSVFVSNTTADIDNSGTLNLKGTNSFEKIIDSLATGVTNVKTGTSTVSDGITQKNINISYNASLISNGVSSAILDNAGTFTNNSTFTANSGSSNAGVIDGSGNFTVNGTFTNNGDFSQNTLTLTNGSTFTAADGSTLTLNNISNDSNGGLFDTNNSTYTDYSIGKAALNTVLNLAIDMSIANSTADTFTLKSGDAGSGIFNISSLDISAADQEAFKNRAESGYITQKILNNANADTRLTLDSDVTSIYNTTFSDSGEGTDTFSGTSINWDDTYGHYTYTREGSTEMTVVGSSDGLADTIKWEINYTKYEKTYDSFYDNLNLINVATGENRTFNFSTKDDIFTSIDNAGTTSAGKLTVVGYTDGTNYSTIDADGHSLFDISTSGASVELQNTKITNATSVASVGANNELTLNNSYIDGTNTAGIANAGTLTLKNANTINKAVTGSGITNVTTGTTTLGADLTQTNLNISTGAALINGATSSAILDNDGTLTNNGTFTANTGSSNDGGINGTGTLNLNGSFTNNANLAQNTLNFTNNSTFTTADNKTVTLTNITNDASGGTFDTNNSTYTDYSIGKAALNTVLNLAIDMSIANSTADTFTLKSGDAGSGIFNISSLDISAADQEAFKNRAESGYITQKILNNANADTRLTLDSDVTSIYNTTFSDSGEGTDTFFGTSINWDDTYGHYTYTREGSTEMTVVGSSDGLADTIKWAINYTKNEKTYDSLYDNLNLINVATGENRTFNFSTKDDIFTSTVHAGTTSSGKLTINGVSDGTDYSTINANSKNLFTMSNSGTTVEIQNTKITDASFVANVSNANNKLIIDNSYISNSKYLAITNLGTLTLNNVIFDSNKGSAANAVGKVIKNNKKITNITGTFKNNTNGSGTIANDGSNAVIDYIEADFINNTGGTHGGAIYNTGSATITLINNSNFERNKAANTGGALRNLDGNNYVKFANSTFTENSAGFGGAIHNGRGDTGSATAITTAIIENSVFTKNSATRALRQWTGAGAVYNNGYMEISDSEFNQNATKSFGGGIYFNNGTGLATGLTIDGNYAGLAGGGIYGGNYTLIDSTVKNNVTLGNGGGISDTGIDVEKSNYATDKVIRNVNIYAKDADVLFTNNRANAVLSNPVFDSGNNIQDYTVVSGDYNDVYSVGKVYLNANEDKNITFNGSVILADLGLTGSGELHINADNTDNIKGGNYNFNNTVTASAMNLYNGANVNFGSFEQADETTSYGVLTSTNLTNDSNGGYLNFQNSHVDEYALGTLTLGSDLNIALDVDLHNKTTDYITATTVTPNSHNIIIDAIYLMSDGDEKTTLVTLTEDKTNFEGVYTLSDSILDHITKDTSVANSYSVSYSDFGSISGYDVNKGILIFKNISETLAKAVVREDDVKEYILPDTNELVEQDLTTLWGQSLTITGNNKKVLGNGTGTSYGGVTLGNGSDNQALYVNNVAEFSGFNTAAIINGTKGTVNIKDSVFTNNTDADINNGGTLNLYGTDAFDTITGTGSTNITSYTVEEVMHSADVTINSSLVQDSVVITGTTGEDNKLTIETGASFEAALTNAGTITNKGVMTVNGGSNTNTISGTGAFTVDTGSFTNNGTFTQGTLNFANGGEFVSSGTDTISISNLTNDANGGTFNANNTTYKNYNFGKSTLGSALNLALDMDITDMDTPISDTFALTSGSTGTFNISDIDIEGFDDFKTLTSSKTITKQILTDATSGVTLTVSDTQYNTSSSEARTDGVKNLDTNTINYNDQYGTYNYHRNRTTTLTPEGTDSVKLALTVVNGDPEEFTSLYDNLKLINQYVTTEDRTFNFNGTNTFTSTENAGATATGKLTIAGTKDGDNYSIIDADGHSLFNMANPNTTVEIVGTKIKDANNYVAIVDSENKLILDNSVIDSSNTSGITNYGTLTLKNDNLIGQAVTGSGTTTVSTDTGTGTTVLDADLSQSALTVLSGAELINNASVSTTGKITNAGEITSDASNLTATGGIVNTGDLYFTGGTTQSAISGDDGIVHILGDVTLAQSTGNNVVSLDINSLGVDGVANMGVTSVAGVIANGGDLNLRQISGTQEYSLGNVTLNDVTAIAIDVDLRGDTAEKVADRIKATSVTGDKKILINNINITTPTPGDEAPEYAKVADDNLKDFVALGDNAKAQVDAITEKGFLITYNSHSSQVPTKGLLELSYSDLVSAARATTDTRVYVMGSNDEDIVLQIDGDGTNPGLGGTGITDSTYPFGGIALSVNGAGTQSIVGGELSSGDTTGGIIVGSGQTFSLHNIKDFKGFTTAITNNGGTVNITGVVTADVNDKGITFTNNTTDINNAGTLNLYGIDTFNTIAGTTGSTKITSYSDTGVIKSADVTIKTSLVQDSVEVTGTTGEDNKLTIDTNASFEAALTNAGTVTNKGSMTVNGGSNTNTISSSNDSGEIEFKGNFNNSGTIEQSKVTVSSGTLTNAATTGSITAEIQNAATINNLGEIIAIGGQNDSIISGTGSFTVSDNFSNNGTFTQNDLIVDSGKSFTNTKNATVNNSVNNSGTIENILADAILNFKGEDMTVAGILNNIAGATVNIDGTGTTTLSATTENNGTLNTKSNTDITSAITGTTGSVVNTATTLNVKAAVGQASFTNTSGSVIVDDTAGSVTTTGNISNAGTITSNANNLIATGDIVNTNTLNLTGGTTQSAISGAGGTTHIKGDVTIAHAITDNVVSLDTTSTGDPAVANMGITSLAGLIANGGDLNLQHLTDTEDYSLGAVTLNQNALMAIDVNLATEGKTNKSADNISATSVTGDAKILINDINIAADSPDYIPSYAKVADANLKNNVNIGNSTRVQIDEITQQGIIDNFIITYVTDEDDSELTTAGGYLKFEYSDLVNAVKSLTANKTYIMSKDENVTEDLTPLNGTSLSISGNNKKITGQGSTVGISPVEEGQTLSIFDVSEMSGFDTAVTNTAGTVNLENVVMTGNNTDIANDSALNLFGTDEFNTVTGSGSTTIGDGTKTGDVTINEQLEQKTVTLTTSDDKLTNKGTSTIEDLVNNGTVDNQKTLNITNSVDNANGTIENTVANAVLNFTGEDMEIAGTINNIADAIINIDGAGTTTLSAATENNGNLNIKSDTDVTGKVTGSGSTVNTADNLNIKAAVEQDSFTNTSGNVVVDDTTGSITTTGAITNDGTLTSNSDNLSAAGGIANSDTLNLTGGTNTNTITGTGTTNFSGEGTNEGKISQKDVTNSGTLTNNEEITVSNNLDNSGTLDNNALIYAANTIANSGDLTSNADNLKADNEINNSGTLNLTGGTNTNTITGSGDTNTSGTVINDGSITQNSLNNTGDLTNNSDINAAVNNTGKLTNEGNINGDVNTSGTLTNNSDIKGNVTNSGNADNKGKITGKTNNKENGTFANNGTITDTVENSGNFVNNGIIGGDVTNNETGNFDNNSEINTKLTNSGNVDNVDGVISGDVDNKKKGTIVTKIKGLTSDAINNDGTIKYVDSGSTIRDIKGKGRVELHSLDNGTVKLNNNLDKNTLALYNGTLIFDKVKEVAGFDAQGGTIDALDGKNSTYKLGKVTINGKTNLKLDFDLSNQETDKFIAKSIKNNGGSFNVNAVKVSGMTLKDHIKVHLGDTTKLGKENVTSEKFDLPTVMTPIRKIKGQVSGGYLTYEPTGNSYKDFNPSVMASSVTAIVAGYQNQMQAMHDGFFHMDRYMKYPQGDRLVAENAHKYAALEAVVDYDQNVAPEVDKSMWTKPYTTFERVNLKGGVKVDNIAYGAIYGGDTDMFNMKNGFKGVISGFVGYNGNSMSYDGISMQQNGGFMGATLNAYKGNFFTGVTVSTGASTGDANTAYGKEEITLLTAGIANKTGYNFEFNKGKIILQPSVFTGYSFVNTLDYTNAAGARINQDAINALQIAPGLKLIGNTSNGWQPYVNVDVVWNIFMGRRDVKAADITLPHLAEKTYVQYGAGIQKTWKDRFTGFFETMVRNGGRNGVVLQGGFRWTFGKDYSNVPTKKKYIQPKNTTGVNTNGQIRKTTYTKTGNKISLLTNFDNNYKYTIVMAVKEA